MVSRATANNNAIIYQLEAEDAYWIGSHFYLVEEFDLDYQLIAWWYWKQTVVTALANPLRLEQGVLYWHNLNVAAECGDGLYVSSSTRGGFAPAMPIYPLVCWESGADCQHLRRWNTGDVVFVRCDTFMSQCDPKSLRQKMRFLDAQGDRVKVTYTYALYRWALSAWQEDRSGEWYEISPAEGQYLYALERSEVKDFVELGLSKAPQLVEFDGSQTIKLYNRQRGYYEWDQVFADEYLDFDMSWEIVISEKPIAEIKGELYADR